MEREHGEAGEATTFKDRVSEFWRWYAEVAERFYATIEGERCEDLTEEVTAVMRRLLPTLGWEFGPGEQGGHSFTVTGEGRVPSQLLAEYWRSRAPELPGWTFYGARQPTLGEDLRDISIRIGDDEQIDANTFLLKTSVDEENELIDLVAWHPALEEVPEEHHFQLLFLLLDEALGEFGTQLWLGELEIAPIEPGEENRRLADLPEFVEQVKKYHGWEKLPPLQAYSLYKVPEQTETPRGDTVVGTTCVPDIIFDFLENGGQLSEDPYEGTGAEVAYVAIDGSVFPEGSQSEVRGEIEDALNAALVQAESGRTLGGAYGLQQSYIDLLLLDGADSRRIVQETLERLQLQDRAQLIRFQ